MDSIAINYCIDSKNLWGLESFGAALHTGAYWLES